MALLSFGSAEDTHSKKQPSKTSKRKDKIKSSDKQKKQKQQQQQQQQSSSSSWNQIKNLVSCKQTEGSRVHDPSKVNAMKNNSSTGYSKLGSCSSICSFRDVVHGNTRVVHRADNSPESSSVGQETGLLSRKALSGSSSRSLMGSNRSTASNSSTGGPYSSGSSSRGMQFRKLSGCYECHMIVDPSRFPLPRSSLCVCSDCGEVFPKIESLELHQAVKHAVSELGPEDSGRNIVEIIFKSSWLKKDNPICKIERILKVQNTQRTIQRFEDCRDAVKNRANTNTKKNPRCAADGNELLRFYSTSLTCSLGARGSSGLCGSGQGSCGVCTIIRHGFRESKTGGRGVRTTASSGRAHDCVGGSDSRRAMLVCRVIAGRVRHMTDEVVPTTEEDNGLSVGSYDSVAGLAGAYSNLEELYVSNPRAILPCFVVIYQTATD